MDQIEKTIFLEASPERVWDFLTQADLLALWFQPAQSDLEAGQSYGLLNSDRDPEAQCWGEVLEADRPHRLVYSFTHTWLEGRMTRVEWTLTEFAQGTHLRLVHDGFAKAAADPFKSLCDHDVGWDGHLSRLRVEAKIAVAA
ncbi:SRPBCC family protein [Maricaulis sp. D1M11]|uniref:SRPBCC family protein n=1 Tax=Maricaulis sp. D1M11 TaxID=3076117 RepID=UPI0039B66175